MDTLEPLVQNLTPTELLDIYTPNAEVWIRATRYHTVGGVSPWPNFISSRDMKLLSTNGYNVKNGYDVHAFWLI